MDRWGVGDRVSDVRLQVAGLEAVLHRDYAGTALWLWRGDATHATAPGLPADAVGLHFGPGDAPAPWRRATAPAAWLERLPPGQLLRLDPNLRVRATAEDACTAKRDALGRPPVLVVPDVFEPDFCLELIEHLEGACAGGTSSGVLVVEDGMQRVVQDASIKQRRESPPRDPMLEQRMHALLLRRALPEISRAFQFNVQRRDPFKLLAYPHGAGYFRAHRDNDTPDVAHRRFALSVNLDAARHEGGAFRFPEFGDHDIAPPTGAALVFSCSLLHEVRPVTAGTRYAMTTFLA